MAPPSPETTRNLGRHALGVAIINGHADPGRRRSNLVHELGHHLIGDAFDADLTPHAGRDIEQLINAFMAHFLLPRTAVLAYWNDRDPAEPRLAAIGISFAFRTSWSVTCNQLRNLEVISEADRSALLSTRPTAADAVALGERWTAELEAPAVPPEYGRMVMSAYAAGKLTAARTEELLWGTVQSSDLPEQRPFPLEALRREFEPIQ